MAGKLSNIRIKELPEIDLDLDLFGQVGVGLTQLPDINIGVTELLRIDFLFGFRPMRIHLPLNFHLCISLFGLRILDARHGPGAYPRPGPAHRETHAREQT